MHDEQMHKERRIKTTGKKKNVKGGRVKKKKKERSEKRK